MSQYRILSNEDLFTRWRALAHNTNMLAGIIQNDMVMDFAGITEWIEEAQTVHSDLETLINETTIYAQNDPIIDPDGRDNWIILASTLQTTIRVKLKESLTREEAEQAGRESCEAHEFEFHGVYTDQDIREAEMDLDIPF